MLITGAQMQAVEESAFRLGIAASQLMTQAAGGIASVVRQFFPSPGILVLYVGKGNNAGDALEAAIYLRQQGWQIFVRLAFPPDEFKELPAQHWEALQSYAVLLEDAEALYRQPGQMVLLDGLVGIGAKGVLREPLALLAKEMNLLRQVRHATTLAVDLPSGLDEATGLPGGVCVQADITITLGLAKKVLLGDAATSVVGRLCLVPLPALQPPDEPASEDVVLTPPILLPWLARRPFDFHKGQAGRVGIIAGSPGLTGAAILTARAVLRGGAGLVTLYARPEIQSVLASQAPPEVMVKPVSTWLAALDDPLNALAIGPGMGSQHSDEILQIIARATVPTVMDADALNILAAAGVERLAGAAGPRLLTPHPGEMRRLCGSLPEIQASSSREAQARLFTERLPTNSALLLKGARTVIAAQKHPLAYNTTGHPGMATGGIGDGLTGLSAALLAQGIPVYESACIASWLSGRAAEIQLTTGGHSPETLAAGDLTEALGEAFRSLRTLGW